MMVTITGVDWKSFRDYFSPEGCWSKPIVFSIEDFLVSVMIQKCDKVENGWSLEIVVFRITTRRPTSLLEDFDTGTRLAGTLFEEGKNPGMRNYGSLEVF